MSWFSQAWKKAGGAVQAVTKPFIASIPVVGGFAASRILMSPTPAQGELVASTSPQVEQFREVVRQDTVASQIPTPTQTVTPVMPVSSAVVSSSDKKLFGLPRNAAIAGIAVVVLIVLLLIFTRKR